MIPPYVKNTNPQTEQDYEDAINEAHDWADELEMEISELREEANWWDRRIADLWEEYYEKFRPPSQHPVGPGQTSIELNPDFFKED